MVIRSWQFISAHTCVGQTKLLHMCWTNKTPPHVLDKQNSSYYWIIIGGSSYHHRSMCTSENNYNMPRKISANQEKSSHSLEATLFGVICNSCATKVIERGNGLLLPSAKVIRAHWTKCACSVGRPVADNVAKTLKEDMKKIRHHSDLETVAKVAADHFPPGSTEMDAYVCKDCRLGFILCGSVIYRAWTFFYEKTLL